MKHGYSIRLSSINGSCHVPESHFIQPAGKRLILQWMTASLGTDIPQAIVSLQTQQIITRQNLKWTYGGPFASPFQNVGSGFIMMSSAVFATYGPGESPHINLYLASPNTYEESMTLSGYLIDATN